MSDLLCSSEYFATQDEIERHVAPYREQPGFLIRSASIIISPSKLLVGVRPEVFFLFHQTLNTCWRVESNTASAKNTDTKSPRAGSGACILLPSGSPLAASTVPGILVYFYWRTHLGGHRLTREGVNFSTFRFQVTLTALSSSPSPRELATCGDMLLMADDAYREDTMWCLE